VTTAQRAGVLAAGGLFALTVLASWIAPYDPGRQFPDYPFAPPMRPHLLDDAGRVRAPFVYPIRLADPLERRYEEDRQRVVPLRWFGDSLVGVTGPDPWFPLGSDSLGRDVLSRLALGARLSLGVAIGAALLALALGVAVGATAGYRGGWIDEALMRAADLVLVLPGIYVILALRGAMPLVLSTAQVFGALVGVLGLVGWPGVARGVRGIFITERREEYAEAARALGAGPLRIMTCHLLPAARGFLLVQVTVLVPAFILAEATISFAGLGFAAPTPSWGAMLQDAGSARVAADAPWLLAPAGAIITSVLALHMAAHGRDGARWAGLFRK
jgi:peptide/nickel transport system permease protein